MEKQFDENTYLEYHSEQGLPVKNIETGEYGVSASNSGTDENAESNNSKPVKVYFLNEYGIWRSRQIHIQSLVIELPKHIPGEAKQIAFLRAMDTLGDYFYHNSIGRENTGRGALDCAKEYARVCRGEMEEKAVFDLEMYNKVQTAETIEEILF